ncbi:MAG: hypothetical protein Q8R81_12310 [Novosphingobium sp.]|uniref:hypothetical protein n=1 Tax=Novosphingobium sp. TaxID=1874826 RepID=UPI002734740A|nr:hypothetical protein [Novosphingobium sp.]MDP3551160.1 hypothetical protein [Novosphingobium sp.]
MIDDSVDHAGFMQVACIIDEGREYQSQRPSIAVGQSIADSGEFGGTVITRFPTFGPAPDCVCLDFTPDDQAM